MSIRNGKPTARRRHLVGRANCVCISIVIVVGSCAIRSWAGHYFTCIPPKGAAKYLEASYAIWIPDGVRTVRGIIVHQHGCGRPAELAGETATFDLHWQALAMKWDFALMGASYRADKACQDWCDPDNGSGDAFIAAIGAFASQSRHAELTEAPWVLWGHSGGAEWVYRMFTRHSDKVLVVVLRSGPPFGKEINVDSLETPVLYNLGMKERGDQRFGKIWENALRLFEARAARDGLETWAPDPQASHDCRFGRLLVIPYIDACLEQRLGPAGDRHPNLVDPARSWLGNIETCEAAPTSEYRGERSRATWLPNERIARKWHEFVRTGWVTDDTGPASPVNVRADKVTADSIELTWRASADLDSGIKTFNIYRNDKRVSSTHTSARSGGSEDCFQKPNYHDTLETPLRTMTFTDTGLSPDSEYTYQVSTVNWSDLESDRSKALTVATKAR